MAYLDIHAFGEIEAALQIKLPTYYKDFHLTEHDLVAKLRSLTITGIYQEDQLYLASNSKWIIEHNRDFLNLPRRKGFLSNKICIGTDGCGNDSFISLDGNDTNVYFLDHESWEDDLGLELDFDFENNDVDWSVLISDKNLHDHVNRFIEIIINCSED